LTPDPNSGAFEAALEVARSRERLLAELREKLEHGDDQRALELARRLVGIGPKAAQ
jgi:hypothetical protein